MLSSYSQGFNPLFEQHTTDILSRVVKPELRLLEMRLKIKRGKHGEVNTQLSCQVNYVLYI
jgi:hypothetical protein